MKRKRTRSAISKTLAVVVACVCLSAFAACERELRLKVANDANPPTFKLSGNGGLIYLFVYEVTPGKRLSGDDRVMWKIKPTKDDVIDDLPESVFLTVE